MAVTGKVHNPAAPRTNERKPRRTDCLSSTFDDSVVCCFAGDNGVTKARDKAFCYAHDGC
jgi:hypothetical protein